MADCEEAALAAFGHWVCARASTNDTTLEHSNVGSLGACTRSRTGTCAWGWCVPVAELHNPMRMAGHAA